MYARALEEGLDKGHVYSERIYILENCFVSNGENVCGVYKVGLETKENLFRNV